ncbi:MAG: hypothetical protein ABI016_09405 [Chthoniobacterales bacterium]
MKMTRNITGPVALALGLAAMLGYTFSPSSAHAQDARNRAGRIEGVWHSDVTIQDCTTGTTLATFQGLGSFIRGGALVQDNNLSPTLGKVAQGKWAFLGGAHYTASFQFFRFDGMGIWTGTQSVTRDIQLDAEANSFTSVISSTTYDVNGVVIATGCGVETATRVVF